MEIALLFKIPLYKLLEEMPYQEYITWLTFLKKRPIGIREDYRAAAIIKSLSKDAPITEMFPSLAPKNEGATELISSIKSSKIFSLMKTSVGDTTPEGFYEN
jgi:hypothetical protein